MSATTAGPVVALSGGVGGAKLVHGLSLALPAGALTAIVNTGDDFRHLGLHVSPDLDSVLYALADLSDPVRGWGRREETWAFMHALRGLGGADWFQLGDRDLALHIERTWRLAQGATLTDVTRHLCRALGIATDVLPMSDDPVRTQVRTDDGWLEFQEYFVHQQCRPAARGFRFTGADTARPQPAALAALTRPGLRAIVICPSNPFVSVDPILAVPGIRAALQRATAPVIAVTPIIGGQAVKGPAAKMMAELGLTASAETVAHHYTGLIDGFVIDQADLDATTRNPTDINATGTNAVHPPSAAATTPPRVTFFPTATLMRDIPDRLRLAQAVLQAADTLTTHATRGAS